MKTSPRFEDVLLPANLSLAWHKVSRGRTSKVPVLEFRHDLEANLASLADAFAEGSYRPGPLKTFTIRDPKERLISAAGVADRVAFHALMNVYDPVFDRHLIHDSYACRMGKGTHRAVLRAFHFAKASSYFLKMDVRRYFYSINHAVLKEMLANLVTDRRSLDLFGRIVDSAHDVPGRGVPIGNLTSQYFANHYLSCLDHRFKERLHARRYLRYMDDILVFGEDPAELKGLYREAVSHAGEKLGLVLKPMVVGRVEDGAPFLGFLVRNSGIFLQRKTKLRYRAGIAGVERKLRNGLMDEAEAGRSNRPWADWIRRFGLAKPPPRRFSTGGPCLLWDYSALAMPWLHIDARCPAPEARSSTRVAETSPLPGTAAHAATPAIYS